MNRDTLTPERSRLRKILLRNLGKVSIAVLAKVAFLGLLWLVQHHFDLF